jgi:hypothetical protein
MKPTLLVRLVRTAAIGVLLGAALPVIVPIETAQATSLAPLTVDDLTDASTYIVRGTVTRTWTEYDDQGYVWTRAAIAVSDVIKGPDSPTEIVVDTMGGTIGDDTTFVWDAAQFSETEEVVLFLDTIRGGTRYSPVGMWLGKFAVRRAPGEDRELAVRFTVGPHEHYDGRFIPTPPADKRIYLDDVMAQVERRLDAGWDGRQIPGIAPDKLREVNTPDRRHR